jgi:S1-C subfamily serine protease
VTSGIISAVNRNIMESPFDDYIQTDAAINSVRRPGVQPGRRGHWHE